jgi:hypothetical protein
MTTLALTMPMPIVNSAKTKQPIRNLLKLQRTGCSGYRAVRQPARGHSRCPFLKPLAERPLDPDYPRKDDVAAWEQAVKV